MFKKTRDEDWWVHESDKKKECNYVKAPPNTPKRGALSPVQVPDVLVNCNVPREMYVGIKTEHYEEKTMYYDDMDEGCMLQDKDTKAQTYLQDRLHSLNNQKSNEMELTFGLRDDDKPRTPKDLIDRITSGKYMVPQDRTEKEDYEPLRFFRWRDPAVKEDREGYKAKTKELEAAHTTVMDTIMIGTPTEALASLKDFESKTFH